MNHSHSRIRLRLLTSTLCLVICTLVLVWGSAFKASLYHTCRELAHVPTAKFLSEHERPHHLQRASAAKPDIPPAPRAANHVPAFALLTPRRALLLLPSTQHPQPAYILATQDAAHGIYFHRPPPMR